MKQGDHYKIDKGVKLPPPGRPVASITISKAVATMELLEKGDSFLVKDPIEVMKTEKRMRDYNARQRESAGRVLTSRRLKNGLRVWRTK